MVFISQQTNMTDRNPINRRIFVLSRELQTAGNYSFAVIATLFATRAMIKRINQGKVPCKSAENGLI